MLAFHDDYAELEFMGDCMPDGSKIVTTVRKEDVKRFNMTVQAVV